MLKIRINKSEHSAEYFRYSCWKMFYFQGVKEKIETCLFLFFYFLLFCVIARCVVKSPLSLSDHKCANTVLLEVIPKADCITEEMMIIFLFYFYFLSQKLTRGYQCFFRPIFVVGTVLFNIFPLRLEIGLEAWSFQLRLISWLPVNYYIWHKFIKWLLS